MSKRVNSFPSCSASCLASSVLPTPVGPVKRKQHEMHGVGLTEHDPLQRLLERSQALAIRRRRLPRRNSGDAGDDAFDVGRVHDQRRRRGPCAAWVGCARRVTWIL